MRTLRSKCVECALYVLVYDNGVWHRLHWKGIMVGQMTVNHITERKKIQEVLELFAGTLDSLSRGKPFWNQMAEKFYLYGNVITLEDDGIISSFAAFYANDVVSCIAYISMLAVLPESRGKGLASRLIDTICITAAERGMKFLRLEVKKENKAANNLYLKHNFQIVEEHTDSYIMERTIKESGNGR